MKYMQDGGHQNQPLMRLTLGLTLALLLGFWVTNFAMYFSRMGLAPSSVASYYLGSEEDFRPPRSAESMLETTHMHLPMMGMVLLVLTHLLIFVPLARRAKVAFIVAAFAFAVMSEGAGWLVRFVSPSFAALKVVGFLGMQAVLAFLLGSLAVHLARGAKTARGANRRDEDPMLGKARADVSRPDRSRAADAMPPAG